MNATGLPTLQTVLAKEPPSLLCHYTSSDGLIGILKNKEVWASNIAFLNDSEEVEHAIGYAKNAIENKIRRGGLSDNEIGILNAMHGRAGNAAKRYYVASFSEDGNLLSQWRAYCPPGGGHSIGVPSTQLSAMAQEQGFSLVPCVYEHNLQSRLINELVDFHLADAITCLSVDPTVPENSVKHPLWRFTQRLTQVGCLLKHGSFREEREWRLLSQTVQEPHPQLDFRSSPSRIVPFFRFKLASSANPNLGARDGVTFTVISGPTSDRALTSMAVQFMVTSYLPTAAFGASDIPYRTW